MFKNKALKAAIVAEFCTKFNIQGNLIKSIDEGFDHFYDLLNQYVNKGNGDYASSVYSYLSEMQKSVDSGLLLKIDGEETAQPSCKKGCSFCCAIHVDISVMEGVLLVNAAKLLGIELDFEKLKRQGQKNEKTWVELSHEDRSCVFLDKANGSCRVYAYRPGACRNHYVVSNPLQCELKDAKSVSKQVQKLALTVPEMMYYTLLGWELDNGFLNDIRDKSTMGFVLNYVNKKLL